MPATTDADGNIVLKPASYYRLLERVRTAEALQAAAEEARANVYAWVDRDVVPRERDLSDRLTFVYGVARARGATVEELGGSIR